MCCEHLHGSVPRLPTPRRTTTPDNLPQHVLTATRSYITARGSSAMAGWFACLYRFDPLWLQFLYADYTTPYCGILVLPPPQDTRTTTTFTAVYRSTTQQPATPIVVAWVKRLQLPPAVLHYANVGSYAGSTCTPALAV